MATAMPRADAPVPGGVAWLDVRSESPGLAQGRVRTGPLGLQITPLAHGPFYFKGARLRGSRCMWSASTVCGAELYRPSRVASNNGEPPIQLLVRAESAGTVFEPSGRTIRPVLRVLDPFGDVREHFPSHSHLFTLNVYQPNVGVDPDMISEMTGHWFVLSPLQVQLLRTATGVLLAGTEELGTASAMTGVDRYLAALAGLILRTTNRTQLADTAQLESVRQRTDSIIFENYADPMLTPAGIAERLNVSLRQLYRAFDGAETPAARIRRRRLERAAEILSGREPHLHVERVAMACGFTSAEYFSRAFRREFGVSPRAYRSAHRDGLNGR